MKIQEQKFRKLKVWNKAMRTVKEVYQLTGTFPKEEIYGLTGQLRRAATSVALNIAEGSAAETDREFRRFLSISLRSAYEVVCGLEIAVELEFCGRKAVNEIIQSLDEISAMLNGLKKRLNLKADI